MTRPLLLDLYCGAGGAAVGYHRAGFDVIGVDINPQPRYPFEYYQGDALTLLPELVDRHQPVAVTGSPPCQDHSSLSARAGKHGTGWLLPATREAFQATGLPYVIENVMGADMRPDVILCGGMFDLRTYRHRQFELGRFWAMTPAHPRHVIKTSTRKRRACWDAGMHISVTGDVGTYVGRLAMGIDWMTRRELSQAIPPAYTRFIGEQLLAAVTAAVA